MTLALEAMEANEGPERKRKARKAICWRSWIWSGVQSGTKSGKLMRFLIECVGRAREMR